MVGSAEFKRPKLHYPLVEIFWYDTSAQETGWKSVVDKIEPTLVHSVGFLVHEDEEHYVIAMDVANDKEHNQRSQIPKGMVKNVTAIRGLSKDSVQRGKVSRRKSGNVPVEKVDGEQVNEVLPTTKDAIPF